jgi:hypothetical protein
MRWLCLVVETKDGCTSKNIFHNTFSNAVNQARRLAMPSKT